MGGREEEWVKHELATRKSNSLNKTVLSECDFVMSNISLRKFDFEFYGRRSLSHTHIQCINHRRGSLIIMRNAKASAGVRRRDLCIRNEIRKNLKIRALFMHTKHANVNDTSSVKNDSGFSFFSERKKDLRKTTMLESFAYESNSQVVCTKYTAWNEVRGSL